MDLILYLCSVTRERPFFDTYRSDTSGFLRDRFDDDYLAKRSKQGVRPRIEQLVCGASPIPCLETNIYATPSKLAEDLPDDKKDLTIFEFLLREIQPDAIFLYRAQAIDYFQKRFNCEVDSDRYVTVGVFGHETHVSCPRRGRRFESVSYDEVYASGKQCRNILTPTE